MGEVISLDRERSVRRPPSVDGGRGSNRRPGAGREPLWREVSGGVLRDERRSQGRTLADVAGRAGMSVQHLSEVERGRKEASSEMLAAAAGALGLSLAEVTRRCSSMLAPTGPVLRAA